MEPAQAVVADGVSKNFNGKHALKGVSLEVQRGQVVGLLGPNGAGKTTLIKIVLGLLLADTGRVFLRTAEGEARVAAGRIGVVMEGNRNFYANIPAMTNAVYFAATRGVAPRMAAGRFRRWAARFGLDEEVLQRPLATFSRGMQQKAALAISLLHDPDFVILDEPTLGLDPGSRLELEKIVRDLVDAGKGLLIASHDLGFIQRTADRVVFIREGRVVLDDATARILRRYEKPWYLVRTAKEVGDLPPAWQGASRWRRRDAHTLIFTGDWEELRRDLCAASELEVTALEKESASLEDVFMEIQGEGHDVDAS
ncbi:ABC transporter related protein [Oceanithermus profundus DSM 14977]|uniref:ABC transporter related protein n=1 Tax=Oceanithermus profundus (strain DSM 14977 / NBRC 100410 / VKM B-2274 / 506) TaxID=670487 RepID=E4UA51_OCEP5|nr:ABC transporter ATP-binding protein [Oceanithermus profundus]ADR37428.1 ABC transporter related protein [Oceanithermus profundus DSM 14977]